MHTSSDDLSRRLVEKDQRHAERIARLTELQARLASTGTSVASRIQAKLRAYADGGPEPDFADLVTTAEAARQAAAAIGPLIAELTSRHENERMAACRERDKANSLEDELRTYLARAVELHAGGIALMDVDTALRFASQQFGADGLEEAMTFFRERGHGPEAEKRLEGLRATGVIPKVA